MADSMTRDDWASIPLALNALANSIMAPYPTHGVAQNVAQQYDIAQQNMITAKEEEAARQAAKKANRQKNRMLVPKLLSATGLPVAKQIGDVGQVAMGGSPDAGGTATAVSSLAGSLGGMFPSKTNQFLEQDYSQYNKMGGF